MHPRLDSPATGVIVTGGASGLGHASAEALATVGRPLSLWDLDAEKVARTAQALGERYGVAATGIAVDVRDPAALRAGAESARAHLPSIGGLVHAAGVVDTESIDGLTPENWDAGMHVHLRPLALLAKELLPDLAAQAGSAIVAFASINATLGNAANPIYTAAKGGVLSLVRSLADRLAPEGIRVNAISPGQIRTPMLQPALDALPDGFFEKRILMERLGEPEEIGRVVRFLLSDEASYVTAAEFVVDGGNLSSQRG
ncbi:MAG: SDR family oxidoreductase [Myxococcota bacterium]|nr:SDR family oxidoreductase [Myxococcota bacterium]